MQMNSIEIQLNAIKTNNKVTVKCELNLFIKFKIQIQSIIKPLNLLKIKYKLSTKYNTSVK